MKTCPHCKGHKVTIFDSDNDWCETCRKWFPAVAHEKCHKKCKPYGKRGEVRHHRNCLYYPASFSKVIDRLEKKYNDIYRDISLVTVEIQQEILKRPKLPNVGKIGCMNRLLDILHKEEEEKDFEASIDQIIKDLNKD
ncbi:MAG: hypothetical protein ACXQT0_04780 [Candidatus Methanofastidiosia archaeon]